ncbi:hypothetical protein E2C01_025540 [Portunus trituberculatus]|uniref:Uncharacterized protein n=1 Tax=Portunus trituberculatus TaxID=210409 RepID=A0A5B7EDM2_PORTR|nr:hypothetical protein [Portunus trituberculatus]
MDHQVHAWQFEFKFGGPLAAARRTTRLPVLESPSAVLFVLPSVLLAWERILVIYCQHGHYQHNRWYQWG